MNKSLIIADDNIALCNSLKEFFDSQESIDVVGIASNGTRALELIESTNPDFLLLDIVMQLKTKRR